jgi:predicted ribosome quality control (RQC) complex YloA/Tae2 family protein
VYHFENKWLFKFNKISLVFDPKNKIFIGEFDEREKNIHSVCRKLRLTLNDKKVLSVGILNKDRTVVFEFQNNYLILENYAKGNIVLTDKEHTIIVLTRIYGNISHGNKYTEYFDFNMEEKEIQSIIPIKLEIKKVKPKKERSTVSTQVKTLENKIVKVEELIKDTEYTDFEKLSKLHSDRKKLNEKLEKAKLHEKDSIVKSKVKIDYITLNTNRWYHEYHWWRTKSNLLVVGGKNADQNEKLVKSYLKDTDYYFHSDSPGCGSFILFNEAEIEPGIVDFLDVANGVLALSQQWKNGCGGEVYYVLGHQVSKTPPSGEYITKGSFIINGTRNYLKVDTLVLGYTLTKENELMLGPYSVVKRINDNCIKLTPKPDTKKGNLKKLNASIKKVFNIKEITVNLFNYPCNIN